MKRFVQALLFYPLAGFLYFLSVWPLWLLFRISDGLYYFLYYITGYRKKVVRQNLQRSFPDKPLKEIIRIEKKYYRHLSDLLVENIRALSASGKKIQKRCSFVNPEVLDNYADQGKDVIVIMGHLGNWEWSGLSMSYSGKHQLRALYRPLKDPFFNRFFLRFRSRLGGQMIPMQQVARYMYIHDKRPVCTTFIADQTPPPQTALWTYFLHQDTPFFTGYTTIAGKFNLPVVMATMHKTKRGYYRITLKTITEDASSVSPDTLVITFAKELELAIREQPAYWLWSHKRWKHKRLGD